MRIMVHSPYIMRTMVYIYIYIYIHSLLWAMQDFISSTVCRVYPGQVLELLVACGADSRLLCTELVSCAQVPS